MAVLTEPLTVAPSTVAAAGGATGAGLSTVAVSFCVVAVKGTEALPAGSTRAHILAHDKKVAEFAQTRQAA